MVFGALKPMHKWQRRNLKLKIEVFIFPGVPYYYRSISLLIFILRCFDKYRLNLPIDQTVLDNKCNITIPKFSH